MVCHMVVHCSQTGDMAKVCMPSQNVHSKTGPNMLQVFFAHKRTVVFSESSCQQVVLISTASTCCAANLSCVRSTKQHCTLKDTTTSKSAQAKDSPEK